MSKAMERATAALRANPFAKTPEQALLVVLAFLDEGDDEIRRRIKLGMLACPSDDPDDDARAVVLALRSLAEGKDV